MQDSRCIIMKLPLIVLVVVASTTQAFLVDFYNNFLQDARHNLDAYLDYSVSTKVLGKSKTVIFPDGVNCYEPKPEGAEERCVYLQPRDALREKYHVCLVWKDIKTGSFAPTMSCLNTERVDKALETAAKEITKYIKDFLKIIHKIFGTKKPKKHRRRGHH